MQDDHQQFVIEVNVVFTACRRSTADGEWCFDAKNMNSRPENLENRVAEEVRFVMALITLRLSWGQGWNPTDSS